MWCWGREYLAFAASPQAAGVALERDVWCWGREYLAFAASPQAAGVALERDVWCWGREYLAFAASPQAAGVALERDVWCWGREYLAFAASPQAAGVALERDVWCWARVLTVREALEGVFAAWRDGDALRSAAYFALDGTYREARRFPIVGRDAIVAHFTTFFRDGPRWEFFVDETLVEGERAAVRYRFALEEPDGSWRERGGCAFVAFVDGTIAEWREYEG